MTAVLLGSLAVVLPPSTSSAAPQEPALAPGLGLWLDDGEDFVGFYVAHVGGTATKVYCVRPDSTEPTSVTLRTVSRLPDVSRTVTRLLAETLTAHGDARTATQAAAVSQALNKELGNYRAVHRRAALLPDRVQELADRYVAEARRLAGPYRLTIDLPRSPLPGQSARGSVTLTAAAGPARGTVQLRHTPNVTTPDELHTRRTGRARFTYTTPAGGPVHIAASADVAPITLQVTQPAPGTQLMVAASPPAQVRASATYEGTGPDIHDHYACSSECDGHPLVTVRACAPASQRGSRITLWLGEGVSRRIYFAAAAQRQCKSIEVTLADRTSVGGVWQYRKPGGGWTRKYPAGGSFVVDCPAPPPVAVLLSYDCAAAKVTVLLGRQRHGRLRPVHNTSGHRMFLVVRGSASGWFALPSGATATPHTFRFACGTGAAITVRSGVQRTGGAVNYGDPLELTMP
jgi:hypothetical protein